MHRFWTEEASEEASASFTEELEETAQKLANQHQRKSEEDKLNVSRMELNEVREEEKRLSVKLATWKDRATSIQGQKDLVATETENLKKRQESLMAKNRELSHSVIHLTNIVEGEVGIPDQIPACVQAYVFCSLSFENDLELLLLPRGP